MVVTKIPGVVAAPTSLPNWSFIRLLLLTLLLLFFWTCRESKTGSLQATAGCGPNQGQRKIWHCRFSKRDWPTVTVFPPPFDTSKIQIHNQLRVRNVCVVNHQNPGDSGIPSPSACPVTLDTSSLILAFLTLYFASQHAMIIFSQDSCDFL